MITLLLSLAVTAAPKDCGEDRACYEALAKTCQPVKLTQKAAQNTPAMTARGVNVSTVSGKVKKVCVVEYEARLEEVHLKTDGGAAAEAKAKEQSAANPLAHLRCELSTDDVVKWEQDGAAKGRSHYPSEKLKECKAPACEPAPALDVDCVFVQCLKDEWKLQCAASGKTCNLKAAVRTQTEKVRMPDLPSARANPIVGRWSCDAKGEPECH